MLKVDGRLKEGRYDRTWEYQVEERGMTGHGSIRLRREV